ncbi:hypothetical protein F5X98DRAFT_88648 [Xylaria grammica]|nr:hypothetical protein F5X98DRAFT_88648 [Xylaria grammica]
MGLSMRVGAAALASLVALGSVVNAQGYFYQDFRQSCAATQEHQYLGCAPATDAPLSFEPSNWDPNGRHDQSWIEWDSGDHLNNTISPFFCARTCRAHGFKYAALWFERRCRCGGSLSYTDQAGNPVVLSPGSSETPCTTKSGGGSPDPCSGDRREFCGSDQGARIWVDPSFPDLRSSSSTAQSGSYSMLGCFANVGFPTSNGGLTSNVQKASSGDCLTYCAGLGSPLAFMTRNNDLTVGCNCGADFSQGTVQAAADANCGAPCNTNSDNGCVGQNCCSLNGAAVPVYANVEFMGCVLPVIPGRSDSNGGYSCFATPSSIASRATTLSANYAAATITNSGVFVATATVTPAAAGPSGYYVNYGCWVPGNGHTVFASTATTTLTEDAITVESCVSECSTGNYQFALLTGNAGSTSCLCSNTVAPNYQLSEDMTTCNQQCGASQRENCGGPGYLIYARGDVTSSNAWAASWTASRSATPVYSCSGSGKYYRFFSITWNLCHFGRRLTTDIVHSNHNDHYLCSDYQHYFEHHDYQHYQHYQHYFEHHHYRHYQHYFEHHDYQHYQHYYAHHYLYHNYQLYLEHHDYRHYLEHHYDRYNDRNYHQYRDRDHYDQHYLEHWDRHHQHWDWNHQSQ